MKDYRLFDEPYKEPIGAGSKYREEFLYDLDKFLSDQIKCAGKKREEYVSPEKMQNDREFYRKEFEQILGFPYSERNKFPKGEKADKIFVKEDDKNAWYRMVIEIMPGFSVYGILLERKDPGRHPFVLAQHGGGGTPEVVNGWVMNSANYSHMVRRLTDYDTSVFSLQTFMWSSEHYGIKYDRIKTDSTLRQLGGSITALEMLMFSRVLDYFENQPFVDKDRMGMIGLSYGGMHALTFPALDQRIKSTFSSCFFNDRAIVNWTDWAYKDALNKFTDAEVGALIAPRALYIEVGRNDQTFCYKYAEKEYQKLKEYYKAANSEEKLKFRVFDGVHELSYEQDGFDFLFSHLNG